MPRFRNRATGSMISVGEDYAARLSSREWEPLDKPEPAAAERATERPASEPEPEQTRPAKKAPAKRRKGGGRGA